MGAPKRADSRGGNSSFLRRGTLPQKVLPADRGDAKPLCRGFVAALADDEGAILGEASSEFPESPQRLRCYAPGGDFDRPPAPAPVEDAVHLERLLAPVGHALLGIPRIAQAAVLDPRAEA